MARQARIEYAGAVHHVRSRGNSGQAVFLDDQDRIHFLELMAEAVRHYGWLIVRIRMVASDSKGKPLTDAKAEFLRTPQHVGERRIEGQAFERRIGESHWKESLGTELLFS